MPYSELQSYGFETESLRAGALPDGTPYVIAIDLCQMAGLKGGARNAIARLDDDEKGVVSINTPGGPQDLVYVTESGFNALVLSFRIRKDHPNFEKFRRLRKWVTSEVLPSIRKTGSYTVPSLVSSPAIVKTEFSTLDLISMGELLTNSFRKQHELEQSVQFVQISQAQLEQKNHELGIRLAKTQEELIRATADAARAVRTVTSESNFFTLVTWAEGKGVHLPHPKDGIEGKVVSGMCKAQGVKPGQWKGPRYSVGTYPEHILYQWLDDYNNRDGRLKLAN